MNLGLSQLSDDQLVELLAEICAEAAARDPFVRKAAQDAINSQAAKLKLIQDTAKRSIRSHAQKLEDLKAACDSAVNICLQQYRQQLETDVVTEIHSEIMAGTYRPMTPTQEAAVVVGAAQRANTAALNGVKPEVFEENRQSVMRNLIRMGHSVEDVERMYGKL